MIFSNLQPGQYRFRLNGAEIEPNKGARNAQTPAEGKQVANEAAVAVEANVVLMQADKVFTTAQSLDDSPFDLNNVDHQTTVLNGAPMLEENSGPLGEPSVKGFLTGRMTDRDADVTFKPAFGEEMQFESSVDLETSSGIISRKSGNQTITIAILQDGQTDVTVANAPETF